MSAVLQGNGGRAVTDKDAGEVELHTLTIQVTRQELLSLARLQNSPLLSLAFMGERQEDKGCDALLRLCRKAKQVKEAAQ